MKVAITGGTGFVGSHLATRLSSEGHEVVRLGRRSTGEETIKASLDSVDELANAFAGCHAVAHCAGINREVDGQTIQRVHVEATRNVVEAARRAGVEKIVLMSFLRARPDCGSAYHESKWAAEEIVRESGVDYTIIKAGVVYGRGDPSIAARFNNRDYFKGIDDLASRIVASGVKRIEGDLVGDETYFVGPQYGSGWEWEDMQWW